MVVRLRALDERYQFVFQIGSVTFHLPCYCWSCEVLQNAFEDSFFLYLRRKQALHILRHKYGRTMNGDDTEVVTI